MCCTKVARPTSSLLPVSSTTSFMSATAASNSRRELIKPCSRSQLERTSISTSSPFRGQFPARGFHRQPGAAHLGASEAAFIHRHRQVDATDNIAGIDRSEMAGAGVHLQAQRGPEFGFAEIQFTPPRPPGAYAPATGRETGSLPGSAHIPGWPAWPSPFSPGRWAPGYHGPAR